MNPGRKTLMIQTCLERGEDNPDTDDGKKQNPDT